MAIEESGGDAVHDRQKSRVRVPGGGAPRDQGSRGGVGVGVIEVCAGRCRCSIFCYYVYEYMYNMYMYMYIYYCNVF